MLKHFLKILVSSFKSRQTLVLDFGQAKQKIFSCSSFDSIGEWPRRGCTPIYPFSDSDGFSEPDSPSSLGGISSYGKSTSMPKPEHRYAKHDHYQACQGFHRILQKAAHQDTRRCQHEEYRDPWITRHLIRPWQIRLGFAQADDSTGSRNPKQDRDKHHEHKQL